MKLTECQLCSLKKHRQKVVLPVIHGGKKPIIMFLGEAPGHTEDRRGTPFCGAAGKWHHKIRSHIGLPSITTNVVKCRPVVTNSVGVVLRNGKPTEKQMKMCSRWLYKEISATKPKLIILYGQYPIKHMLDLDPPVSEHVGKFYQVDKWEKFLGYSPIVFAAYHPATLCYQKDKYYPIWKKHLQLINNYLKELNLK